MRVDAFRAPARARAPRLAAAGAAAALVLGMAGAARAQVVPFPEEMPLAPICRTVVVDPSGTIRLEVLTGLPEPNGLTFTVHASRSDGGEGHVSVTGAHGESGFSSTDWGSGRPYRLIGTVRPHAGGAQCYVLAFDVEVHVPAAGYRRLAGNLTVKSAKPMPLR
jgi:hypothetical protein